MPFNKLAMARRLKFQIGDSMKSNLTLDPGKVEEEGNREKYMEKCGT